MYSNFIVCIFHDNEDDNDIIVISERKDWVNNHCVTDDSNQDEIYPILQELGLFDVQDADYEMGGTITDADEMILELVKKGFGQDEEFSSWIKSLE